MKKWIMALFGASAVAAGVMYISGTQTIEHQGNSIKIVTVKEDSDAGMKARHIYVVESDAGECNCGTVKNLHKWKNKKPSDKKPCNNACYEAFGPPEKRCAMCDGELCRYGKFQHYNDAGEQNSCDPDAPQCVSWPCTVIIGSDPEKWATEDEVDAGE